MIEVLAIMVSKTMRASGAWTEILSKADLLIDISLVLVSAAALKCRRLSRNQSVVPMMEPGPN